MIALLIIVDFIINALTLVIFFKRAHSNKEI